MRLITTGLAFLLGCLPQLVWSDQNQPSVSNLEPLADPRLGRFVTTILESNPEVQAARAALEASGALETAAGRPLYNPELEAGYEDAVDVTWDVGIGQSFDWNDKRGAKHDAARAERMAMRAEYLAVRRETAVGFLTALTEYQYNRKLDQLAAERSRVMNEFSTLAVRLFDAGDLNQVELDLATLAALDAQIQRAAMAADLAEARQNVRFFTPSVESGDWPELPAELPALPSYSQDRERIASLPEIQAARQRVAAAEAVVELRQRQTRADPTLSLRAGQEDSNTLIGVNFSIPLYIRNSFDAEVSAALAERNRVQQLAENRMRLAWFRYLSATERYQLSRQAWQQWQQTGIHSLQRKGDLLKRMWQAGELSTTDYLVQLRQTLDTRQNALHLERGMWRAWFEWLAASGQVDHWLQLQSGDQS